jgi:hypothetical protein
MTPSLSLKHAAWLAMSLCYEHTCTQTALDYEERVEDKNTAIQMSEHYLHLVTITEQN